MTLNFIDIVIMLVNNWKAKKIVIVGCSFLNRISNSSLFSKNRMSIDIFFCFVQSNIKLPIFLNITLFINQKKKKQKTMFHVEVEVNAKTYLFSIPEDLLLWTQILINEASLKSCETLILLNLWNKLYVKAMVNRRFVRANNKNILHYQN